MTMSWKTIENPLWQFEANDEFAKFHASFANKSPPPELFHYTSGDALLVIINSQIMFATESSFLNDPQEVQWGIHVFQEYIDAINANQYPADFIEQIRKAMQEKTLDSLRFFVLSLSANPDLLSQWRAYASNGEGFAVGLDGPALYDRSGFGEHVLQHINLDAMPREFVYCFHLLPVIYEKKHQMDLIANFIDAAYSFWANAEDLSDPNFLKLFRMLILHRIGVLLISFKNPGYLEESEWRIVAMVHKKSGKIEYRNGRFGITPYVKLNLSPRSDLPNLSLPITTMWVGPNSQAKQNKLGIEMICKSKTIESRLKFSQIDYRT